MTNISSIFGSIGEYSISNTLGMKNIKECVYCYRMNILVANLYSIIWNFGECRKKSIPTNEGYQEKEYLEKCLLLCQLNKNTCKEAVVQRRLQELNKG